jgi:hypothetical protein
MGARLLCSTPQIHAKVGVRLIELALETIKVNPKRPLARLTRDEKGQLDDEYADAATPPTHTHTLSLSLSLSLSCLWLALSQNQLLSQSQPLRRRLQLCLEETCPAPPLFLVPALCTLVPIRLGR